MNDLLHLFKKYTNKNIEEDLGLHDWLKFIEYSKEYYNCHPLDVDDEESAHALVSTYISWLYQNTEAKILKGISEIPERKSTETLPSQILLDLGTEIIQT